MKLSSRPSWAGLVAMAMMMMMMIITTSSNLNGVLAAEQECDANGVCKASSTCVDDNDECETWASQGTKFLEEDTNDDVPL